MARGWGPVVMTEARRRALIWAAVLVMCFVGAALLYHPTARSATHAVRQFAVETLADEGDVDAFSSAPLLPTAANTVDWGVLDPSTSAVVQPILLPASGASFSVVLCARVGDLERARILFATMRMFWSLHTAAEWMAELVIVMPSATDRPAFEQFLRDEWYPPTDAELEADPNPRAVRPRPPVRLLTVRALLGGSSLVRSAVGQPKQMAIKLAIALTLSTEFYLVLDSDVIATRKLDARALLVPAKGGSYKALMDVEGRAAHEDWWQASERLLKVSAEERGGVGKTPCVPARPDEQVIRVTPAVLSRTVALRTLSRLQYLYGPSLGPVLHEWKDAPGERHKHFWSEYTLFFITAKCLNLYDRLFVPSTAPSVLHSGRAQLLGDAVWSAEEWHRWSPAHAFGVDEDGTVDTAPALFTFVQSNSNIPSALVASRLMPYITDSRFQRHFKSVLQRRPDPDPPTAPGAAH